MTSKHLIDPELVSGLETFPQLEINQDTYMEARTLFDAGIQSPEEYMRPDISVERKTIQQGLGGPDIEIAIIRPKSKKSDRPGVLHIHGGGYIIGSTELAYPSNVRTAAEVDCVIVSVEYRLSPEVIAPAAVEDCYAGLKWLYDNAKELGVDRKRIAVSGESAGGGLAASLAQYALDKGEIEICFQLLIYPMLDDRTAVREDINPYVGEYLWNHKSNAFGWTCLLGQEPGLDAVPPYSVPARRENLAGLPPAYIYVGSLDLFLQEDVEYAMRLLAAGVSTELHVFPGAFHGFEGIPDSSVAQRAERESRHALLKAFNDAK